MKLNQYLKRKRDINEEYNDTRVKDSLKKNLIKDLILLSELKNVMLSVINKFPMKFLLMMKSIKELKNGLSKMLLGM